MFENQVVWITGASSGIGEALALQFADASARLVLSSRREEELKRVRNLCLERGLEPDRVLILPLDVTDYDAMQPAVAQVINTFDRIDMLINNAGVSQRALCVETDLSTYRQLMEIDFFGQIALTKAVLPQMIRQGSGHIGIMSSVAGKVGAAIKIARYGFKYTDEAIRAARHDVATGADQAYLDAVAARDAADVYREAERLADSNLAVVERLYEQGQTSEYDLLRAQVQAPPGQVALRPGAVTPFAIVNDKGGEVTMVLDKGVLGHRLVNAHPLVNHMTTALTPADLLRFLEAAGHPARLLDLGAAGQDQG